MYSMGTTGGILLITLTYGVAVLGSGQKDLVKRILDSYAQSGVTGRPASNSSDPTRVSVRFGLMELREFDIQNQEVVMVGWTALEWQDSGLTWDAEETPGSDEISVSPNEIWVPDIILTNSISKPEPIHNTRVHVTSSGQVTWVNTYRYHFYCKIATDDMDSDTFDCYLKFASWSMGSDVLDLYNKGDRIDANYYINNREWELFKNRAKQEKVDMPWGDGLQCTQVKYEFTLKRREEQEDPNDMVDGASEVKVTALLPALVICLLTAFTS